MKKGADLNTGIGSPDSIGAESYSTVISCKLTPNLPIGTSPLLEMER